MNEFNFTDNDLNNLSSAELQLIIDSLTNEGVSLFKDLSKFDPNKVNQIDKLLVRLSKIRDKKKLIENSDNN